MIANLTDRFISSLERPSRTFEVLDTKYTGFCLIVRPSGRNSFCIRYRNAHGRKRTYTIGKHGKVTMTQARAIAKEKLGQIANGIDIQEVKEFEKVKDEIRRNQTLGRFFENKYEPYMLSDMKSGKERAAILKTHFIDPWKNKPLTDINEWLVLNWRKKKLKEGRKAGGVNRPISALKALLNKAVKWKVIEQNPITDLAPLTEDTSASIRFMDSEEEQRLIQALDRRQKVQIKERNQHNAWKAARGLSPLPTLSIQTYTDYLLPMVLTAINTGMRRGELFDLQVEDIDLKGSTLTVRGDISKSGKTREIPLNQKAHAVLKKWIQENKLMKGGLVFSSPVTGKRFNNINKSWKGVIRDAQLEDVRFHDLRHTFASNLVMRGANLYTVKDLLGHANIETTQRYAHLAEAHKAEAVELLDG